MKNITPFTKAIEDFKNLSVLIIGDVMVDSYLWGKVERISPEAPVPIVSVSKRENRLGGAANVALNIKSLGAKPLICSVIGNDLKGDEFIAILKSLKIETSGIIKSPKRKTTTKFRVIGNNNHLLRVDEEIDDELNTEDNKKLLSVILDIINKKSIDVIIFEDYDKGVITPCLIKSVVEKAKKKSIPVVVDPKKRNFQHYNDVSLFKPNLKELKEGLKVDFAHSDLDSLNDIVGNFMKEKNIMITLLTLSEAGILVLFNEKGKIHHAHFSAYKRNISDVSGAGDTVISVAALCLASGLNPKEMADISNLAGGLVCEEIGVVPIEREKLIMAINKSYE